MGIICLKKYFFDVNSKTVSLETSLNELSSYTPSTVTTIGELKLQWTQNLFSYSRSQCGLIIRSVTTVFNTSEHGFYDAELNFSFMTYGALSLNTQLSLAGGQVVNTPNYFKNSVDLMWDGLSSVSWRDLDYDIGSSIADTNCATFTLTAKESTASGPIIHSKKNHSAPMYISIVLEYY